MGAGELLDPTGTVMGRSRVTCQYSLYGHGLSLCLDPWPPATAPPPRLPATNRTEVSLLANAA